MIRIFIVKSDLPLGLPINFDSETFEPNNRTSEIFQDYHLVKTSSTWILLEATVENKFILEMVM